MKYILIYTAEANIIRHLSACERGIYATLLMHQHETGAALPVSFNRLYAICNAQTVGEELAVRSVSAEFFPVREGGKRAVRVQAGEDPHDALTMYDTEGAWT